MPDRVFLGRRILLALCMLFPAMGMAEDIIEVGPFSKVTTDTVLPAGWEPLNLGGADRLTEYTLVKDSGKLVVRAVSENSASALFYPIKINLEQTPIVQWRWKVESILKNGDATRKDGDDYPARLYILFDYDASRLSWFEKIQYEAYYFLKGRYPPLAALNYLWANKLPLNTQLPNVYSDRVQMFVVRSGKAELGQWVTEQRNIYEDYKQAFGEAPPVVAGIAIMTDTDNTGERATSYFGDIRLLPAENE